MSSQCGLFSDNDRILNIVKKSFLTEKAVRPVGKKLIFSSTEQRYSRLAVQRTQAANGHSYTILYLLTGTHIILIHFYFIISPLYLCVGCCQFLFSSESGFLHKVVLLVKGPHIIEEIQIFKEPQTVKNILLSTSKVFLSLFVFFLLKQWYIFKH